MSICVSGHLLLINGVPPDQYKLALANFYNPHIISFYLISLKFGKVRKFPVERMGGIENMKLRFLAAGLILAILGIILFVVHGHRYNYLIPTGVGIMIFAYGLLRN